MTTTTETVIDHDTGTVIPEETKQGIIAMSQVEAGLAEMQAKYTEVPDVETDEGYEKAKSLGREVGKVRIKVDKARKLAKDFYLKGGRDIDAKAKAIATVIGPLESQYTDAVKAVDERKAAEEAERARVEQERIEAIETRIARIKSAPSDAVDLAAVNGALTMLKEIDLSAFEDFTNAAQSHVNTAIKELTEKQAALTKQAEEAEALEKQRKEQEAAQAKIDAENQRIAKERAEFEAEKKAEADKQAEAERRREAEARAEREKEEAAKQAEIDKAAAVEQAKKDEVARIERERVEAEKKAAAGKAEAERLAAMAPDADKLSAWLESVPDLPAMDTQGGREVIIYIERTLAELDGALVEFKSEIKKEVA